MSTEQSTADRQKTGVQVDTTLRNGSILMVLGALGFVGYGLVFLVLAFVGDGFEIGVTTLDGLGRAQLAASSPETAYYIVHLHVATAAFIVSTGFAVAALSWYGVRRGQRWAWATAVIAPVVALALAIPMHWTAEAFAHDWMSHLGPIYLATIVFVVGAAVTFWRMRTGPTAGGGG